MSRHGYNPAVMWRALPTPILVVAACAAPEPAAEAAEPLASGGAARDAPREAAASAAPAGDLARFAARLGWPDGEAWVPVPVTRSEASGSERRLWFHKDAVTAALLAHEGGRGFDARPLRYPQGSVFIAEELDASGEVREVQVLETRAGRVPRFELYGADGAAQAVGALAACADCHAGDRYYQPMISFPNEPRDYRVDLDERWRDVEAVKRFLEGYHRGESLFGPYGAMWMAKLRADADRGALSSADRERYERLLGRYADLLD